MEGQDGERTGGESANIDGTERLARGPRRCTPASYARLSGTPEPGTPHDSRVVGCRVSAFARQKRLRLVRPTAASQGCQG